MALPMRALRNHLEKGNSEKRQHCSFLKMFEML